MCGPILAVAGGIVSAIGSIQQANAQAAGLEAQSKYNARQSVIESNSANYEASRTLDKGRRVIGAQRTAFVSSGFDAYSGSGEQVALDSMTEVNMDVAATRYGGKIRSSNFAYQSKIDSMNAGLAKAAGPIGAVSNILGALGSTNIFQGSFA